MISFVDIRLPDLAQQVWALQQAAYTIESQLIGYSELPPLLETVENLQDSGEQFLAWIEKEEIRGTVSYTYNEGTLEICRLVVSPLHFRRGIAGQLLKSLESKEAGAKQIVVSTAEKNQPAILLYQKHGYHLNQRWVLPDGLALVRLHKLIPEGSK